MAKICEVNWELLCKTVLALNDLGIYIKRQDGHYWIECDDNVDYPASSRLKNSGVSLNNKIYHGYIEAVETLKVALDMADIELRLDFEDWDFAIVDADMSRICQRPKNEGGIV